MFFVFRHPAPKPPMLTPADLALVRRMRAIGMLMPVRTLLACRATGLPLPLGCSILTQESGGGRNEWGHDGGTIFAGGYDALHKKEWGETVTKEAYLEYRRQRGVAGAGGMQGVGPTQLTWWAFQDEADRLGGCWLPLPNMKVGFADLAHNVRRYGLPAGVASYNGTGAAAKRYATEVLARAQEYAKALKLPWPP